MFAASSTRCASSGPIGASAAASYDARERVGVEGGHFVDQWLETVDQRGHLRERGNDAIARVTIGRAVRGLVERETTSACG